MVRKKNFHFSVLVFFFICCVFLLGECTSVFALTPSNQISAYGAEQLFIFLNNNTQYIKSSQFDSTAKSLLNDFCQNADWNSVASSLNSLIGSNDVYLEQLNFCLYCNSNYPYRVQFAVYKNNNTIGTLLPHLRIYNNLPRLWKSLYFLDR